MYEQYIRQIYDNSIELVLKGIDDNEVIKRAYYSYLNERYLSWFQESNEDLYDTDVKKINILEQRRWENIEPEIKKHLLIKDENIENIKSLYFLGNKFALNRIENSNYISKEECDKYIEEIKKYLPNVLNFNKELGTSMVFDAEVNFKFAANLSDYTTLQSELHLKQMNDEINSNTKN